MESIADLDDLEYDRIFNEGVQAWEDDWSFDDNPYRDDSPAAMAWEDGFYAFAKLVRD
jgi:hypothetical protein